MPTRALIPAATTGFGLLGPLLAASLAQAAPSACGFSSDPCTLDFGQVTVTFGQGAGSYAALAEQIDGTDGYYGASPDFLSSLQAVHSAGHAGFSFTPQVYADVGGSGVDGFHQVRGSFEFHDLSFTAKPGYRIDGVKFVVTGTIVTVGNGSVSFGPPGTPQVTGNSFEAAALLDAENTAARAEFMVGASYLQGHDGTALSYGTAHASFEAASLVARASPVPEPSSAALLGLGILALNRCRARRHPA